MWNNFSKIVSLAELNFTNFFRAVTFDNFPQTAKNVSLPAKIAIKVNCSKFCMTLIISQKIKLFKQASQILKH